MMNLIWLHGGYLYMNCDDMKYMTSLLLGLEWPDTQRRFVFPRELGGVPDLACASESHQETGGQRS
jgi:hypothetical protein